jgi:hypothetical protein
MQQQIAGRLKLPENKRQRLLHQSAGQFLLGMQRRRDAAEVQRDRLQCAPQGMLPIVF